MERDRQGQTEASTVFPPMAGSALQAIEHLRERGAVVLPALLAGDQLREARDAVYAGPADDRAKGRTADEFALDGDGNVRVWNLLNRGAVFSELVQHPLVLELLKAALGWPALLGNFSANIAEPGGEGGALHADQIFVPTPWPAQPQGMNVAWLLDDFTSENGATEMVPDSHDRTNPAEPPMESAAPVIASAGTAVVFESRVWHRTGSNRSEQPRAAAFAWYTKPIYRAQENWFLALDEKVLEGASENLLTLLGYRAQGLGLVYGGSPR